MNTETPNKSTTQAADSKRHGFRFGIPAVIPSLLMAGAITLGVPMGAVLAVVAIVGVAAAAVAAVAGAYGAVAGVAAAGAGAALAAGAFVGIVAGLAGLAGFAAEKFDKKYSPKKVFAGIVGGSALGAALTYGAAVNAPQAPEKAVPPSTLHIETRGGDLCRDFTLSENKTATLAAANDKGQKTYTLTVPKGCVMP